MLGRVLSTRGYLQIMSPQPGLAMQKNDEFMYIRIPTPPPPTTSITKTHQPQHTPIIMAVPFNYFGTPSNGKIRKHRTRQDSQVSVESRPKPASVEPQGPPISGPFPHTQRRYSVRSYRYHPEKILQVTFCLLLFFLQISSQEETHHPTKTLTNTTNLSQQT